MKVVLSISTFSGLLPLLTAIVLWPGSAIGAAPVVTYLVPAGAQRGTQSTVSCQGTFSWPLKIWAPGVETAALEEKGKFSISIPAEFPSDRIWLRFYNEEGASPPQPFLIGALRESHEVEPNDSPQSAQIVSDSHDTSTQTAVTINGILQKRGDVDSYSVSLTKGQTLVAAVAANTQFGSPIDSILQVVSPQGIVLAENHDDVGLDPRLAFECTKSGTYIVRVVAFPSNPNQSIQFHGSESDIYRLTLTTGPFITHAIPLTVSMADSTATVEPRGWNIPPNTRLAPEPLFRHPDGQPLEIDTEGDTSLVKSTIGLIRSPTWAGSARIRMVAHAVEMELANDTTEQQPTALVLPTSISGCIRERGQTDYFRIPLKQNEQVSIFVESLSLGSPLVPLVALRDPQQKVVAEVRETGNRRDAALSHKPTQDGDHFLTIRDRFAHGGEHFVYRLTVAPTASSFSLATERDSIVLTHEKPFDLPLTVTRQQGVGAPLTDIQIEAFDLPRGVSAEPVISKADGDTSGKVTIRFTTNGTPFSGPIRIRGTAAAMPLERFATTPPKFGARFHQIWLTVQAPDATGNGPE